LVHLSQYTTKGFGTNIYNFAYDGANRITAADFSGSGQHNTSYTYDKNGNIESLTREGRHGGSNLYGDIDNLTYTYNGNQLLSVNDVNDPNHQNNGFTDDGSFLNTEYTYDDNGNLLSDLNKNLSISKYNHLNLPEQLNLNPPQHYYEISYLYSAAGQKLHKATHIDFTPATTTDYVGSFIYQDGQLQSILTPEGRVVVDGSNYEYQYFLKDHLGNTRITFNQTGTIIQEDSYYPYGMNMTGLSHISGEDLPNKYRYNGKELQDDFGLDWYDYGARFYDAQLGRWHVVDPLAEDYFALSPYNYVANNPLKFIDPNGMWIDDYFNKNGRYLGSDEAKTDYVKIIDQKDWDDNKTVSSDGSESIEHKIGNELSKATSESTISTEAEINIADHYNPSDLELEYSNEITGMQFYAEKNEKPIIKINSNNLKDKGYLNYSSVIKNLFSHENKHYSDYRQEGHEGYLEMGKIVREQRAYDAQLKDKSFKQTPIIYQTSQKGLASKYIVPRLIELIY